MSKSFDSIVLSNYSANELRKLADNLDQKTNEKTDSFKVDIEEQQIIKILVGGVNPHLKAPK